MKKIFLITLINLFALTSVYASHHRAPVMIYDVQPIHQFVIQQPGMQFAISIGNNHVPPYVNIPRDHHAFYPDYNERMIAKILEANDIGETTKWWNPQTGSRYSVTPMHNLAYRGNPNCRAFRMTIHSGNTKQKIDNVACRVRNGSWVSVD